ncbi:hypothetical protein LQV05_000603 [Cryptococcus neoformans]|nr:hypothetical protein J007_00647 [Cryptococcus neoformans var. grubii]OXC65285.1 hypothetical protein C358_00644 [Cryptococcus neoformans var. grubii MW-RSA852]UOH79596.1 hypothetical protein LQV05_000603 [Cryptococcus neoformans]
MTTSSKPPYLHSASSLIKTLRAPGDTPEQAGLTKVQVALKAWSATDLNIPRKAEILRDWVLEAWNRAKPNDENNALVQPDYHSLLLQLGHFEEHGVPPPLQILSSFFDTLLKSDDPKSKLVLSIAPASFKVLFDPQDMTYKAENWVDVWANMLKLLSRDSLQEYEVQLSNLVDLVTAGIQRSQASSTNPKKNAQTATNLFAGYCQAYLIHPSLRSRLHDGLVALLFHPTTLQTSEPFGSLFAAIEPSLDQAMTAEGCLLALPRLFNSLVSVYHQNSFALFTQASSSRIPLDVFVASKERDAVRRTVEKTVSFLDSVESKHSRIASKESSPWIVKTWIWQSRVAVWQALVEWGGYMEREEPWGRMVDATARRAEAVLSTYATDGSLEANVFLGTVLETLATLEKLDHDQANIGPDIVRWCLAAPSDQHTIATRILSSLLRFHQLTHTIPAFFTLLITSLRGLFDSSLPEDITQPLYQLTIKGPLVTKHFREEVVAALRTANPGKRRSAHWNLAFGELARVLQDLVASEPEPEENSKKRKAPHDPPSSSASLIGIHSRLLSHCLEAALETTYDGEPSNDALSNFLPFLEDWSNTPLEVSKLHKKGSSDVGVIWPVAVSAAGRLRVIRCAEKLLRRQLGKDKDLSEVLGRSACPDELKLELVRFMYHRGALRLQIHKTLPDSFSSEFDAVLSLLESALKAQDVPSNALWQVVIEQGLVITDFGGSASQMSRLASICVKAFDSYPFILNLFASAELWELHRLRGAFQETILQVVSSDPASLIPFLSACPPGHLGRKARNSAIEALYAQKNLEQSLEWLSRMAVESESFGPLTQNADVLVKLAKMAGKHIEEPSSALVLWKKAIGYLCNSPSQYEDLLIKVLEHYFKLIRKVKRGKSESAETDIQAIAVFCREIMAHKCESFPDAVRKGFIDLSDKVASYVQPLLNEQGVDLARLGSIVEVYNTVMSFSNWVGVPAKRSGLGMKLAATVLMESQKFKNELDAKRASKAVLEIVGEESNCIEEKLAVVIMFYSTFPKSELDETVRSVFRDKTDDAIKTCIKLVSAKSSRQHAVMSVLKVVATSCTKPDLVKQALHEGLLAGSGDDDTVHFVRAIVEDKVTMLQTDDVLLILSNLYHALFLSLSSSTFNCMLESITIINRRRPELIFATLPQLVQFICYVFPRFQVPRTAMLFGQPSSTTSLTEKDAKSFSRLLVSLAQSKPARSKVHEPSPLAKHVPAILVAYIRACADPSLGFTTAVRKDFEPGLHALCSLTTAGGRANARGREGEGLGTPFGLGEGPGGDGEKELWAELWLGWSKGRYMGQG